MLADFPKDEQPAHQAIGRTLYRWRPGAWAPVDYSKATALEPLEWITEPPAAGQRQDLAVARIDGGLRFFRPSDGGTIADVPFDPVISSVAVHPTKPVAVVVAKPHGADGPSLYRVPPTSGASAADLGAPVDLGYFDYVKKFRFTDNGVYLIVNENLYHAGSLERAAPRWMENVATPNYDLSPDGALVVFERRAGGVAVWDTARNEERFRIVEGKIHFGDGHTVPIPELLRRYEIHQMRFSPDGKKIFLGVSFKGSAGNGTAIFIFDRDGRLLTHEPMSCEHPCFTPDGRHLALVGRSSEVTVELRPSDSLGERVGEGLPGAQMDPIFSPNGLTMWVGPRGFRFELEPKRAPVSK